MRRSTADNPFLSISLIKSVNMWQRSYFYVKNLAPDGDWVNLPPYNTTPPSWEASQLVQSGQDADSCRRHRRRATPSADAVGRPGRG